MVQSQVYNYSDSRPQSTGYKPSVSHQATSLPSSRLHSCLLYTSTSKKYWSQLASNTDTCLGAETAHGESTGMWCFIVCTSLLVVRRGALLLASCCRFFCRCWRVTTPTHIDWSGQVVKMHTPAARMVRMFCNRWLEYNRSEAGWKTITQYE